MIRGVGGDAHRLLDHLVHQVLVLDVDAVAMRETPRWTGHDLGEGAIARSGII